MTHEKQEGSFQGLTSKLGDTPSFADDFGKISSVSCLPHCEV